MVIRYLRQQVSDILCFTKFTVDFLPEMWYSILVERNNLFTDDVERKISATKPILYRYRKTLIDTGMQYDPLAQSDPDVTLAAKQRRIGGLGIFMVKNSMDGVSYEYKDGKDILTIKKNLNSTSLSRRFRKDR